MSLEYKDANSADVGANKFLIGIDESDPQNPVPFKYEGVESLAQLITDAQNAASTADSKAENAAATASAADSKAVSAQNDADTLSEISMSLEQETITYYNAIKLAGGYIKTRKLFAYNDFVVEAKKAGLWSKIVDYSPMDGENLASALIKLKYPSSAGLAALANNNLTESDYQPDHGFVLESNTDKYLGTGLTPSMHGLTNINIGMGAMIPLIVGASTNNIASLNPSTGDNNISINTNGGIGDTARKTYNPITKRVMFQSMLDVSWLSYNNAIKSTGASAYSTDFVTQYPLDTELTVFKTRANGVTSYTTGSIGGLIITEGLTDLETEKISVLLMNLYVSTGRFPLQEGFIVFGDSVTRGYGISAPKYMYAEQLSSKLGRPMVNVGSGGSAVRLKAGNFFPAIEKYLGLKNIPVRDVIMCYGTNDLYLHDATTNGDASIISDYQAKLETIISGIKANGQRAIVLSPPYNTEETEVKNLAYVDACLSAAMNQGAMFMDAYTIFSERSNANTYLNNSLHIGDSGHALLTEHIIAALKGRIYREPVLDFPSVASLASQDLTVDMRGAKVNMKVDATPPSTLESGLITQAWVSSNNTVTVRLTNITAGAIIPAPGQFTVSVNLNY